VGAGGSEQGEVKPPSVRVVLVVWSTGRLVKGAGGSTCTTATGEGEGAGTHPIWLLDPAFLAAAAALGC